MSHKPLSTCENHIHCLGQYFTLFSLFLWLLVFTWNAIWVIKFILHNAGRLMKKWLIYIRVNYILSVEIQDSDIFCTITEILATRYLMSLWIKSATDLSLLLLLFNIPSIYILWTFIYDKNLSEWQHCALLHSCMMMREYSNLLCCVLLLFFFCFVLFY